MTMATRITTATTGSSDRPGAKIFQIRNLPQDCGPLLLQMAERFGHSAPPFAERIIYARFSGSKKETCRILTFMSHTREHASNELHPLWVSEYELGRDLLDACSVTG